MKNENYNWWKDLKNKEEVEKMSWWNHEQNKETFPLPISIINEGGIWGATFNDDTLKLLGEELSVCSQGKSKEEAIENMFRLIRFSLEYSKECELNYQRFVPFRKGDWKHIGGKWFIIFGYQFHFRYGKGMKFGKYIPFTKLNISISSEWKTYRNYKKSKIKK